MVLNGRQSKIVVTDFPIGAQSLIYSTAEIFTVSTLDSKPLVFLWLPSGESGEFYLTGVTSASVLKSNGCSGMKTTKTKGSLIVSYTQLEGSCV